MKIPSPGFLVEAFAQVLRRFPATMLTAFIGVIAVFELILNPTDANNWVRLWMVSMLGLPLLTGLVAFAESRSWKENRRLILQGVGLLLLLGYWFWLDPESEGFEYQVLPGYIALVLVAHLFVAVAPYLNERPVRDFWEYNKELFANIIVGVCFTLILHAGLSLAILAVDELFDIHFDSKIYLRLYTVLAGIFNTAYFLYNFPQNYAFDTAKGNYTTLFKSLCKFILIPIVILYFLILYAYSFKIIGTWCLPRGWVGSLVIGFSVAGILTYLLNFYLPEEENAVHVRGYRRWFWWILFPLTILLFIAIGRRIADYGVTEMRFLVAETGVWIALTCLYFYFSKKDNIKFIPISLGLFALGYAFGPLSGQAVAERSQVNRIVRILQQNGRFEAGKMKPGATPVTDLEFDQFQSALDFLDKRKHLDVLNPMLPMPVDSLPEMPGFYGSAGNLRGWLGMGGTPGAQADQTAINVYSPTPLDPVDILGFRSFHPISLNTTNEISLKTKGDYFKLSSDGKWLEWWKVDEKNKKQLVEKFDLQPVMRKWLSLAGKSTYNFELSKTDRMTDLKGANGTLRLVVETSNANIQGSVLSMEYLNGYVFLK